ncbi:DUF4185 domain-containing protein, partial [bacterium]|nr:DUF4185 domain-containing protein [candidate division CSSED10-310 bacterium]
SHGDLWFSTWSETDHLFMAWGDGCGPGNNYNPEIYTHTGLAEFTGELPGVQCDPQPSGCIRSIHIPLGDPDQDNKPSSLLFIDGRLYFAGKTPLGEPDEGYIAYSDDNGVSWTKVPNSPWIKDPQNRRQSVFRCLMFINMGQNYSLNTDGFVYGLGIGWEWDWEVVADGDVYLTRVPVDSICDYTRYRYFTGISNGNPMWSVSENDAQPVPGLNTAEMGSAIYHEGSGRFIFLCKEGLFEAGHPWGPWTMVSPMFYWGPDTRWHGGYMPALISKNAGADYVYFAASGQDRFVPYSLNIGRIDFTLDRQAIALHKNSIVNEQILNRPKSPPTQLSDTRAARSSRILRVPEDYDTLQQAVDVSISGDTILVADGTYSGIGNINIHVPTDKGILIRSQHGRDATVIDCEHSGRGFLVDDGSGEGPVIQGFAIENGFVRATGGGVLCRFGKLQLRDCRIECCAACFQGGGVAFYDAEGSVSGCEIHHNAAGSFGGGLCAFSQSNVDVFDTIIMHNRSFATGGGVYSETASYNLVNLDIVDNSSKFGGGIGLFKSCDIDVFNCFVSRNVSLHKGGGIFYDIPYPLDFCPEPFLRMRYCTLDHNSSDSYGGGFYGERAITASPEISNSIIWNNIALKGNQIALFGDIPSELDIHHCSVEGNLSEVYCDPGWAINWGEGMMAMDPLFANGPRGMNYLSQIEAGQEQNSPCLNAGSEPAAQACSSKLQDRCMNQMTTRTDLVPDKEMVDIGFHYPPIGPESDGLTLFLEDRTLTPGDCFDLHYILINTSDISYSADIWIILDVFGSYWCYPSWIPLNEDIDYKAGIVVVPGKPYHETVLYFFWPNVTGPFSGLYFYAAAFHSNTFNLIGSINSIEWSYL